MLFRARKVSRTTVDILKPQFEHTREKKRERESFNKNHAFRMYNRELFQTTRMLSRKQQEMDY